MTRTRRVAGPAAGVLLAWMVVALTGGKLHGQQPAPAAAPGLKTWTTAEDHQNMMNQLGIRQLRPGPSGNESAPNHANYDEALANPFPDYPDVLTLKNGRKVASAGAWWKQRRPEIVEDFEREVLGRVPAKVPKVTWTITATAPLLIGKQPAIGKQLVGRVDNSACPSITVEIQMTLITPASAVRPVPVMMMFGFSRPGLSQTPPAMPAGRGGFPPPDPSADPSPTEQLLAAGWGYVTISPASIQADNGAGLTRGIIGLVNKGQPRKPDDWGSLRAWAWGASRGLDYLETDRSVDAKRVGIEGVSRYGKAALVTMAFDQRFAVVLVGSSGEGGAKPHRRNFGEAVENLTGSGEYHWMAGNFLKYGASDATFGSKNAGDIPVDSHELIALCAPRLTFLSYGIPEKGDARWLDQQGSFMATVAAGPAFRLLGARDLGVSESYKTAKMPPVNVGLLDGQLAWRQHDGGHTDRPNWKYFIPWASRFLKYAPPPAGPGPATAAYLPAPRTDPNSMTAHTRLLEKANTGRIDAYFAGDSITRRWGATDYPQLLENWKANFTGWNAGNFGWGADTLENILWRMQSGELDGVNPKVIVLQGGTNNVGKLTAADSADAKAAEIARGVQAILDVMRAKAPSATIIITGIFPRNDNMAFMPVINRVNGHLAALADGRTLRFLNVNDRLADANGVLVDGVTNPDKLHLSIKGYQIWADALKPIFTEILGPPAKEDLAPPPTGDPSAKPARPPVADRLAGIPDFDRRLADLEKGLDAAADQKSLTATTARYTLEVLKEAKADPAAFDPRPVQTTPRPPAGAAPAKPPAPPPATVEIPKKHSAYIATMGITMDFAAELARAEALLADVRAGRDPLASVTGDVHLAYRSDLDGMVMPYRIYVPPDYDKSKKYPLVMFLHGANCDENTFMSAGVLQPAASRLGYIVASINGRGPFSGYRKENGAQKDLFDVMALMQKYYNIDGRQVFLTGHSMGGMGTWTVGLEYRDRFAALAPMAGTRNTPELLASLETGRRIPVLITAGGKDTALPPEPAIEVYRKLRELGYPAKVVVYPEDNHQATFASSIAEVFAWFDAHRR